MAGNYSNWFNCEKLSDLKIVTDDGNIYAHKIILHDVFKNMPSEFDAGEINLKEFKTTAIASLIEYLYTGQLKHNGGWISIIRLIYHIGMGKRRHELYTMCELDVESLLIATNIDGSRVLMGKLAERIVSMPHTDYMRLVKTIPEGKFIKICENVENVSASFLLRAFQYASLHPNFNPLEHISKPIQYHKFRTPMVAAMRNTKFVESRKYLRELFDAIMQRD